MYYVTTESGYRIGPYEDYASAWYAGLNNFGLEGWIISKA